ncbi:MAG: hypothetical protein LLG04_17015 [Parachlamydia sp.]|nr:hypothetical protein [Parachlamydia sp.]
MLIYEKSTREKALANLNFFSYIVKIKEIFMLPPNGPMPCMTPQHQPVLIPAGKRPWHVNSAGLDFSIKAGNLFKLIAANPEDKEKVCRWYLRHSVSGYDIGSVEVIHNPILLASFEHSVQSLNNRATSGAFAPKWMNEPHAEQRRKVYKMFETIVQPNMDPIYPNVKLLPMWHGTKNAVLGSICQTGFANLAKTDKGFFGKGIYATNEAEYAFRVYGKGEALILTWFSCRSAYPVIDGDMAKLAGKNNYENYDAHFVPVVPKDSTNPNEANYFPCKPNQQHRYIELVVFAEVQCFPRFVVRLQATLKKEPKPLIAAKVDAISQIYNQGKVFYDSKSYAEAFKCFLNAAQKGHVRALYRTGLCLYEGTGTQVDYATALKYFQPAANLGDPSSLYMVGLCCYYGHGCIQEPMKARDYFKLAASKGSQEAATALKTLFK